MPETYFFSSSFFVDFSSILTPHFQLCPGSFLFIFLLGHILIFLLIISFFIIDHFCHDNHFNSVNYFHHCWCVNLQYGVGARDNLDEGPELVWLDLPTGSKDILKVSKFPSNETENDIITWKKIQQATQLLFKAMAISCPNYCIAFLAGLPVWAIKPLPDPQYSHRSALQSTQKGPLLFSHNGSLKVE